MRAFNVIIARITYNMYMNCYENLSSKLKSLRSQSKETQNQVADKTGIPRSNLARYETGENIPPLDVLVALAKYYDVTVDYLLGLEE